MSGFNVEILMKLWFLAQLHLASESVNWQNWLMETRHYRNVSGPWFSLSLGNSSWFKIYTGHATSPLNRNPLIVIFQVLCYQFELQYCSIVKRTMINFRLALQDRMWQLFLQYFSHSCVVNVFTRPLCCAFFRECDQWTQIFLLAISSTKILTIAIKLFYKQFIKRSIILDFTTQVHWQFIQKPSCPEWWAAAAAVGVDFSSSAIAVVVAAEASCCFSFWRRQTDRRRISSLAWILCPPPVKNKQFTMVENG